MIRIRITTACLAGREGDVLDVDDETAKDLFREGRAMPVDQAIAARLRPASQWIDREAAVPERFIRSASSVH